MLALILFFAPIFFIWRFYAELAFEYDRSRWGFGMLGVGIYIVSRFVFANGIVIITLNSGSVTTFDGYSTLILMANISAMALGSVVSTIFYYIIKRNWKKRPKPGSNADLLDEKLD